MPETSLGRTQGIGSHCRDLIEKEIRIFDHDYNAYFSEGETKPKPIGTPFLLHNPLSKTGILLIHGLMAAPEEVREWAQFLYSKGYTVYAPRLAGHGTSAIDLATRHYDDWLDSVNRGATILRACCHNMVIGGFSTGAGLALHQAIHHPHTYDGVIAVSAPLKFTNPFTRFVEGLHTWNCLVIKLGLKFLAKRFGKNHPDNPHINYHRCPIQGLVEVKSLMKTVGKTLPTLSIPALIIQGSKDPKVDPKSGKQIFQQIKTEKTRYKEIDFHLHGVIRGPVAQDVFTEVEDFLTVLNKNPS